MVTPAGGMRSHSATSRRVARGSCTGAQISQRPSCTQATATGGSIGACASIGVS